MWSGLPRSLTLQLISIHVQKVHEHLICRKGVIKGRCNLCFLRAWGGQLHPPHIGVQPPKVTPFPAEQPVTLVPPAFARNTGDRLCSLERARRWGPHVPRLLGKASRRFGNAVFRQLPMP